MNLRHILLLGAMGAVVYAISSNAGIPLQFLPTFSASGANSTSATGQSTIKSNEGLRLTAYPDGSGYSIGYGHHITGSDGLNNRSTITQNTAENLFQSDLSIAENAINSAISVPLTQGQFDALADFVYNRGVGNFSRSGIVAAINSGNLAGATSIIQNFDNGTSLASRRAQNVATFEG